MLGSWLEMFVARRSFSVSVAEEIGKPSGIARIFVRIVVIYEKIYHQ